MEILMPMVKSLKSSNGQTPKQYAIMLLRYRKRHLVMVRLFNMIFSLTLSTVVSNAQTTQEIRPTEYQVKAAFLYKFALFVEWPAEAFADSTTPITIGVVGEDPFGEDLDRTIAGKTVKGRNLVIKRFKRYQELKSCHILFVSSSETERLGQLLKSLKGSSILTVSEMERFTRNGGMINFILKENKVRFEINAKAAEQVGLKISSKLLRLATSHQNQIGR